MSEHPVLDKLFRAQVFCVELSDSKDILTIEEACDQCFRVQLTYDGVEQLIAELTSLHKQMRRTIVDDPNLYTTGPDYED